MYREMEEQRQEQRSTEQDKPGLEDLYSSTRPDLVRLAHVITGSNQLAEEVVRMRSGVARAALAEPPITSHRSQPTQLGTVRGS
jgi:hypothetical protein